MHGINFEAGHIEMCCLRCHVGGGNVVVKKPYNGEVLNWDQFFDLKQKFIEDNKKDIIDSRCEGCFNLQHRQWDEERYFSYMHFNHWTNCNANCIYCFTDYEKEFFNKQKHYKVLPVIKDIFNKKLFRPGGEITFAGGEPTILDEFEDLINLLIKNGASNITVHTSGIKFSPALANAVRLGRANVVVSLDSGKPETYKKIKRFDHFKKVWENTKKYATAQSPNNNNLVSTKFIIQPPINDSYEEIEEWLRKNVEAHTNCVVVDLEHEWFKLQRDKQAMPDYIVEQINYIFERAEELGLQVTLYNSARYLYDNQEFFVNKELMPNPYRERFTC